MLIPVTNNNLLFEHRFWLQILGDHSRFILNALSPEEKCAINQSTYYMMTFDDLLNKCQSDMNNAELYDLTIHAYNYANSIRNFKLFIIKRQLTEKIKINLPPTFVNHMVNEVTEYLNILWSFLTYRTYCNSPISLHLLWIPDASGHASAISSNLDMSEKPLIKKSMKYTKVFDDLHLKSIETAGYMRSSTFEFPALSELNKQAVSQIEDFNVFLKELEVLILDKKVLGTISPLMPDHMLREECYYLTKLSQAAKFSPPQCNPAHPRITE